MLSEDRGEPRPRRAKAPGCAFCKIVKGEAEGLAVMEDDDSLAFLDWRPVFPGHTLLVPKVHCETLGDLPGDLVFPLFSNARTLSIAVPHAMKAEGSFVAVNNRVSQGVPHLHVHIVPRRRGDGLSGFFWPRHAYASRTAMLEAQQAIRSAVERVQDAERAPSVQGPAGQRPEQEKKEGGRVAP